MSVLMAAAGVHLSGIRRIARRLVPLSGGLLVAIALLWILPDLSMQFGWAAGATWLVAGTALLWIIDQHVYPICPSCSHTHDHHGCHERLHGFATPLLAAAGAHALLDGWGLAAAQERGETAIGFAVLGAIALHKIPEGLALGVILRAAVSGRGRAIALCAAAQSATLLGGALESAASSHISRQWTGSLLALTGGSFLYLGFHALHGEWKRMRASAVAEN
jgi:zinc transporter ZupT